MSHKTSHGLQHVMLRVPGGELYGLELGAEELAEWLAPDRRPVKQVASPCRSK